MPEYEHKINANTGNPVYPDPSSGSGYRDAVNGEFAEPRTVIEKTMYRYTFAINFVHHDEYYSVKVQTWTRKPISNERKKRLKDKLIGKLEDRFGYSKEYLWFPLTMGEEERMEVDFIESKIGETSFRDEDLGKKKSNKALSRKIGEFLSED